MIYATVRRRCRAEAAGAHAATRRSGRLPRAAARISLDTPHPVRAAPGAALTSAPHGGRTVGPIRMRCVIATPALRVVTEDVPGAQAPTGATGGAGVDADRVRRR